MNTLVFASFYTDGTPFVWYPLWLRKPKYFAAVATVIESGLESAPISERLTVANRIGAVCKRIGEPDDYHKSVAMFTVGGCGIGTSYNVFGQRGVEEAIRRTSRKMCGLFTGDKID